jgi:signal transduction histidine kinase
LASKQGDVVRITVAPSSFKLPADSKDQPSVAIIVDDTGSGVPEGIRDKIFEAFFTAWNGDLATKGSGLGLAVVKSIVTDHGGTVVATTPPSGIGARFTVHIPVLATSASPAASERTS